MVLIVTGLAGCSMGSPRAQVDSRLRVAIVSDSEVPRPVAEALRRRADIHLVFVALHPGYLVAQLDRDLAAAIARRPDVIVYSGGTNDLFYGFNRLVPTLEPRMAQATKAACVVGVVSAFDPGKVAPAQRALSTEVFAAWIAAEKRWGARTVSYADLAANLARSGRQFFAGPGLGAFHPGPGADPVIASAIATAVNTCPRRVAP
ncbi:MAG: hypothetical protein JWN46_797 [Acidimicrobiales bacterium]|nr:hypothetical protein [Acidimicrobiales bacterium]